MKEIEDTKKAFAKAVKVGDAEAVAAAYTEDCVLVQPDGKNIVGRGALRRRWQSIFAGGAKREVETITSSIRRDRDTAYEIGDFIMHSWEDGRKVSSRGKHVLIYRRQENGDWLFCVDIWNNPR